jgi:hypothetical protein
VIEMWLKYVSTNVMSRGTYLADGNNMLFKFNDIGISPNNSAISKMSNLFHMNEITHNVYNRCNSQ